MAAPPTCAVLIANWNGAAFIERCLGSVLAAARHAGIPLTIAVTDDASSDGSPELIARAFPGVRLIAWRENVGYGAAVQRGMEALDAEWVFLLNNDLALPTDFFARLIATLEEHRGPRPLFAIGAQTRDWGCDAVNHGGQRAAWRQGLISQRPFDSQAAAPTDFFQAGACLIHRERFFELGGFAPIFHPGYWEDYDMAWRARRRGWINLYEPRAVAYHYGRGSMRRLLGDFGVSLALRRNHLVFTWLNLHDRQYWVRHLLGLPALVWRDRPEPGQAGWGRALLAALRLLPAALRERRRRLAECAIADPGGSAGPGCCSERELLGAQPPRAVQPLSDAHV